MGRYELSHLWSFFGMSGPKAFCRSNDPVWRELNLKGSLDDKKTEEVQWPGETEMTT